MTEPRRVVPWVLYAVMLGLLAITLWFTSVNGSFEVFVLLAVLMMLGYGTVGAFLASQGRGGPLGWLMLVIALGFVLTGLTEEFLTYRFVTNPRSSLPLVGAAAWLTNWLFVLVFAPIPLVLLLFPTGRVQSPRWRWLPVTIIAIASVGTLATILRPGPVDAEQARILNPTGVESLGSVIDPLLFVAGTALLIASVLSVPSLFIRYRGARGDERQQIRWLAYLAGLAVVLLVGAIVSGWITGEESALTAVFFLALFACVGVAFPVAIGVAILKYRLYDLDLVVKKTVLYATVAVALVALFLVVAVGVGGIAGRTETGAIVAAAVIGLAFWPALRLSRRVADRLVYGRRATPYEVLSEFSNRVGGSYAAEDVLPRMAEILAGAVGASRAVVWLRVGSELRPVGSSPGGGGLPEPVRISGDELPAIPADSAIEVRDRGELLGALAVSMPANDPMNPSKERLVRDLASQAGLVLRNVRLIEELRASRQRLVSAQDEERRRLERNIHDGAQQQLVALTVKLRLLEQITQRDPVRGAEMASQLQAETTHALEDLRDLARGIYPPLLADAGLPAALEAQARKSPVPVRVDADAIGRFSQDVEAAVYFSCLEALQNVAKYAEASTVTISLATTDGHLSFAVVDDGVGFDPDATTQGTGLQGIADRLDALGGRLEIRAAPGEGTTLVGLVPSPTGEAS
jgi:signal transduction histidine kinase